MHENLVNHAVFGKHKQLDYICRFHEWQIHWFRPFINLLLYYLQKSISN